MLWAGRGLGAAQIDLGERDFGGLQDLLQRTAGLVVGETRTQDRVACDERVERAEEGLQVERSPNREQDLLVVDATLRIAQGMEEHSLLHRGELVRVEQPAPSPCPQGIGRSVRRR